MNSSFYNIVLDKEVDYVKFFSTDYAEVTYKDSTVAVIKCDPSRQWHFMGQRSKLMDLA